MGIIQRNIGPYLAPFRNDILGRGDIGLEIISMNNSSEFYSSSMYATNEDKTYFLATKDDILIKFGNSGIITSMYKQNNGSMYELLKLNALGKFDIIDSQRILELINSNISDKKYADSNLLSAAINYAYDSVNSLPEDRNKVIIQKFNNFDANRVIARVKEFRKLVHSDSIIPDYNDTTTPIITIMDGCLNNCIYCPEAKKFVRYSKEKIKFNINLAKEILEKYHPNIKNDINEGFINGSDILWYKVLKSEMDPLEIIAAYKEAFPQVNKLGTFFGIDNLNKVSQEYLIKLNRNEGSNNPAQINNWEGIRTGYVGIETGHELGSKLVGKDHSFEFKKKGLLKLINSGILTKEIFQIGLFGKGFYPKPEDVGKKDKFIPVRETLEDSINLILQTKPYRIMFSEFQNLPEINYQKFIDNGQIVPNNTKEDTLNEVDYIYERLRKEQRTKGISWQGQERHPLNQNVPIEFSYEEFVKGSFQIQNN